MRRVEHLPAVELIHDLYNQYDFRINSIRFRNTVTVWRDGIVNSYAPYDEWENISLYLGDKFYNLDTILISELERLYDSDRRFCMDYLKTIDIQNLNKISNQNLRDTFLNIQNFALGDLYRLNFVQVEHALTTALNAVLKELKIDANELQSLIVAEQLTEFQKEEIVFSDIVRNNKSKSKEIIHTVLQEHWNNYAFMHSAYGEIPYSLEHYKEKFDKFDLSLHDDIENSIKFSAKKSIDKVQAFGSQKLTVLTNLMRRGGVFRDNNKARLGHTMRYKFAVLDEISLRTTVAREILCFYSVREICELLNKGTFVEDSVIHQRKAQGVILVRSESISLHDNLNAEHNPLFNNTENNNSETEQIKLVGLGASQGRAAGTARIVLSYEDGLRVKDGDIMVAIGTDFDLMDAIQRSAAVITEEGGFLSHASVVCRELKKPCCIGVENATRLINDGDFLDVDSEKGIILIKRNGKTSV